MTWYLDWFGDEYLNLYSHRSDDEASRQVTFIVDTIRQECANLRVLDIACGRGRHLIQFAKLGATVSGIDMSERALEICKTVFAKAELEASLLRADMRELPFGDQSFDLITSLFTSFGYFDTDEEHQLLLKEWARCLAPNGEFVLDYINREHVIANLVPETSERKNDCTILQQRSLSNDGKRVEKLITISYDNGDDEKQFKESVRLFSNDEILELLNSAGFRKNLIFGDFNGETFSPESSRFIVFNSKA